MARRSIFIAQIEDINELKRTEQVNQQLMERITLANEAGGIGIWEWELKPNIFSWDKRMLELYEIPPHIKPNWQVSVRVRAAGRSSTRRKSDS